MIKSPWTTLAIDNSRVSQRHLSFFSDCTFRVLEGWEVKVHIRGLYFAASVAVLSSWFARTSLVLRRQSRDSANLFIALVTPRNNQFVVSRDCVLSA